MTTNMVAKSNGNGLLHGCGDRRLWWRCCQDHTPSGGSRGEPTFVSCSFWWPPGLKLHFPNLCFHGHMDRAFPRSSLCVSGAHISFSLFLLKRTLVVGFKAHPRSCLGILNFFTSARTLCPNKVIFMGFQRMGCEHTSWRPHSTH